MSTAIEQVQKRQRTLLDGDGKVQPGQPARFTEAATIGDTIPQGDLDLTILAYNAEGRFEVPMEEGPPRILEYRKLEQPTPRLVPGNSVGSSHILDSVQGIREMWVPKDWDPANANYEGLDGPVLVLDAERTVEHPKHGNVTIPPSFTVGCFYQRDLMVEQQRERRNTD